MAETGSREGTRESWRELPVSRAQASGRCPTAVLGTKWRRKEKMTMTGREVPRRDFEKMPPVPFGLYMVRRDC